jgi:hypothetical protein
LTLVKTLIISFCAVAVALTATAADLRSVALRTEVSKLPAGTAVEAEVDVAYALHELQRNGSHVTFKEVFRQPGKGHAQVRIVAGVDGTARPSEFHFTVADAPAPPAGTVEKLVFPLTYKITCPEAATANGTCHSFERSTNFLMTLRPVDKGKPVIRCLKVKGLGAPEGVSIGIGPCGVEIDLQAVPRG